MLKLGSISKSFGPVSALDGVTLAVAPGSIHGLLGENGAGKSTLMNILFGLLRPDAGTITVADQPVRSMSPRLAQRLGIGMVHQHFKLVPTLSVLENVLLPLQADLGLLQRGPLQAALQPFLEKLNWTLDFNARVETLTVGQQQRVEILKALAGGGKVLILDEPTAVLTPQESSELFQALRTLARGGATIIFISHKLAEVRQVCDTLTILRRGRVVYAGAAAALSDAQIAQMMIGGAQSLPQRTATPSCAQAPLLQLQNVSARGPAGRLLDGVSLAVGPGQIVGIAGVDGNGQGPLVQAIVGTLPVDAGSITIAGQDATHASVRWRRDRMAYVPDDRHAQALILPLSVRDNLLLKDYRKPRFSTLGLLRFGQWRTYAADLVRRFDVRTTGLAEPVGTLSGGNQQKVVLARELAGQPDIVLAVNPTRGLDIGATAFVLQQLLEARNAGAAVLLVHSDLDELLSISDRVLVLYNGTLRDSGWPQAGKDQIGRLMLGVA